MKRFKRKGEMRKGVTTFVSNAVCIVIQPVPCMKCDGQKRRGGIRRANTRPRLRASGVRPLTNPCVQAQTQG